jgi:trehalose/maltose hydrolase-like predicted phosphorylase
VLDASVPRDQISGFSSTLDIRAGTMQWSYTWSPSVGPAVDVEYEMFVHKLYVNQAAVQLKLTSLQNVNVTVIDLLNGDCALRTDFVDKSYEPVLPFIWSAVRPVGISNVTAYIYSALVGDDSCDKTSRTQITDDTVLGANSSSIAQGINVSLQAGKTSIITKYIGGASTDAFDDPQSTALNASWSAANKGYFELLSSHITEWESIMTPDSVDTPMAVCPRTQMFLNCRSRRLRTRFICSRRLLARTRLWLLGIIRNWMSIVLRLVDWGVIAMGG